MSNKRYIEIYSRRRDRKKFPLPSQFQIPLEQTGLNNNSRDAIDPVSLSFPLYTFQLNSIGTDIPSGPFIFSGGVAAAPQLVNTSSNINNFYNGYLITDITLSPPETRTIISYNGTTKVATLNAPFGGAWNNSDQYTLAYDYKFSGGTSLQPQLDPNSANSGYPNFYNGYHITNISNIIPETRVIISYDGSTQTATLDYPFTNWNIGDSYVLRDPSIPIKTSVSGSLAGSNINPVVNISTVSPSPNYAATNFPNGYFIGQFIQILDGTGNTVEERTINDFVNLGGGQYLIYLDNPFTPSRFVLATSFIITVFKPYISLQPTDIYNFNNPANSGQYFTGFTAFLFKYQIGRTITGYNDTFKYASFDEGFDGYFDPNIDFNSVLTLRLGKPIGYGTFVNPGNTQTRLFLNPLTSPSQSDIWNGKYIFIIPKGRSTNDVPSGIDIYRIQKYYGADAPPSLQYSVDLNGSIPYSLVPIPGQLYEILEFSYDNFAPLSYNGSTVSQNQETCYEITLLSLVLPNLTLKSGSRVSFYPYFYVEFGTYKTANNHSNQIIYSNNPNSGRALFITPITDITDPFSSQFIKLNSSDMTQTVKFKPNDTLIFSVYLPNGQPFETVIVDNFSPLPPKPEIQIEAVFSIKRLSQ